VHRGRCGTTRGVLTLAGGHPRGELPASGGHASVGPSRHAAPPVPVTIASSRARGVPRVRRQRPPLAPSPGRKAVDNPTPSGLLYTIYV